MATTISSVSPVTLATRRLQRLALSTAAAVYLLIVIGGVVRITGSGLGCGNDWPLCNGSLLPAPNAASIIEYTHRIVALAVTVLVLATAFVGWSERTEHPRGARMAWTAGGLLALQVILGAIIVWFDLHAIAIAAHLGVAQGLLAVLLVIGLGSTAPEAIKTPIKTGQRQFRRLLVTSGGALYILLVLGGVVASTRAGYACGPEFPQCNGDFLPPVIGSLQTIQFVHRIAALGVGVLLATLVWRTARSRWHMRSIMLTSVALAVGFLLQATIGASFVLLSWPPLLASLHLAIGTATWTCMVALATVAWHVPALQSAQVATPIPHWKRVFDDYVKLTKPGVISLLLVTTLAAMFVAGRPSFLLICWTMLGGYLAAGGANAINCYMDRDVDVLMGRTARRPIPSNRIPPLNALIFGLTLGALSFTVLALFVNVLSAALALFALLFYVLVYTGWLKRSSTQNIVIGGAAGAIPPLIGWAAVTGRLSLLSVLLFVIIFYWTPPHFWALALIRRDDYARARIPMLPVIAGERETKWQILLYSLLLIAITVLPTPFGMLGPVYLLGAVILGVWHMIYVVRLMRESGTQSAWKLYRFSLLYLALLFGAMVLDTFVSGHIV